METIDTKKLAARFDYEFMGKTAEEISVEYRYPLVAVKQEIELAGWTQKLDPLELPATDDISKFASELEESAKHRLSIISLFRQLNNQSVITQIETEALKKILSLVESIDDTKRGAAKDLTTLINAVVKLQEQSPVKIAEELKAQTEGKEGGVTIQILNSVS